MITLTAKAVSPLVGAINLNLLGRVAGSISVPYSKGGASSTGLITSPLA